MMLHRHFEARKAPRKPKTDMDVKEGEDMLVTEVPEKKTPEPKEPAKRGRKGR